MTQPSDARTAHARTRWTAFALALAIFAFASYLSSRSTLFDRDEPRFAQASVEMLASGNWLYPTFDLELRPDKPILVYWLMASALEVLGVSAWAARFWSPVCLALACWFVFGIARRLFDERAGLLAMCLLAAAPLAVVEGTIATTDALLLACTTGVMACFVATIVDGPSGPRYAGIGFWTALALLTKGPVGLAIPLLSIAFALWFMRLERFPKGFQPKRIWFALAAAVVVFLVWAIPANSATHGEYAVRGLGHHVVDRVSGPLEGHGGGYFLWLPLYVPVVVVGFLSALMLLPAACRALVGGDVWNVRTRAVLIGWTLPTFVLMTLVPTKLPHYVLPIFPSLAVACAGIVDAVERHEITDSERAWLGAGTWIFAAVALLIAAAGVLAPYQLALDELSTPSIVIALCLGITTLVAMRLHRRGKERRAAYAVVCGLVVTWIAAVELVMPVIERSKISPEIARTINSRVPRSVPVARWKYSEPSFDFLLGRPPIRDFDSEDKFREWAADTTPFVLVIPRDKLEQMRDVLPAARYVEIASAKGLNLSKGAALELVALGRELPAAGQR